MVQVVAAAAFIVVTAFSSHASASAPALDEVEIEFVRLLNEYRQENGLGCVSVSPTANQAAHYMSQAMGEVPFFNHNEPPCDRSGCSGRDPFERMIDFGHDGWTTAGENIAAGHEHAAGVFQGWKTSPGHNKNMLHPAFTAIGIARVEVSGSPYRYYWTNTFSNYVDGPHDCTKGQPGARGGDPVKSDGGGCNQAVADPAWLSLGVALLALRRRWASRPTR